MPLYSYFPEKTQEEKAPLLEQKPNYETLGSVDEMTTIEVPKKLAKYYISSVEKQIKKELTPVFKAFLVSSIKKNNQMKKLYAVDLQQALAQHAQNKEEYKNLWDMFLNGYNQETGEVSCNSQEAKMYLDVVLADIEQCQKEREEKEAQANCDQCIAGCFDSLPLLCLSLAVLNSR
jgi:hypothetical protein